MSKRAFISGYMAAMLDMSRSAGIHDHGADGWTLELYTRRDGRTQYRLWKDFGGAYAAVICRDDSLDPDSPSQEYCGAVYYDSVDFEKGRSVIDPPWCDTVEEAMDDAVSYMREKGMI